MSDIDDGEKEKDCFWKEAITIILVVATFILIILLAGCETAHDWGGKREIHFCAFYCVDYVEEAASTRTGGIKK